MKIKDTASKKRVGDRLRRIEGQIRGVISMIESESNVKDIIQQLSAVRSALSQSINEEIVCALEKMNEKKSTIDPKNYDEIRDLMKLAR